MTDRNRIKRRLRQRARRQRPMKLRNGRHRRGVLLLVVLSMLVLFMLVGTTFLLTSKHGYDAAKNSERLNKYENQPSDLMERALKQVVRDTKNPFSAIRGHSLLRDEYGTDGFTGTIYIPPLNAPAEDIVEYCPKYAGGTLGSPDTWRGPTKGQLIEFAALPVGNRLENDLSGPLMTLSRTNGYYNGCVLTLMSGPAAGQSVRIVNYVFDLAAGLPRFTVIAMPQRDNSPLQHTFGIPGRELELVDFVARENLDTPNDPNDFVGQTFLVNGRQFNGTGIGYNPQAQLGGPRLSAIDVFPGGIGAELALLPNAAYFNPTTVSCLDPSVIPPPDPFSGAAAGSFVPLNNPLSAGYPSYVGLGGADESYDAPDFQNMYLAWLSATPRAHGLAMDTAGTLGTANATYDAYDPRAQRLYLQLDGYRPVIDDVPLPSFHRPDLAYFWFMRMFDAQWLKDEISSPQQRTQAILKPYGPGVDPQIAAQITAIKRKFMLRPLREDHPNFDGSNPSSRYNFSERLGVTVPPWEVVGPWDVDNDNDGVPDSIWVDLGDPIQETDDGRLYRPLYAFLIIDLDGKLNLNAHGTSEHLVNVPLDNVFVQSNGVSGNLAGGAGNPLISSNNLASGNGWGPADISLRPVLSPNLPAAVIGDWHTDDYARLLTGRPNQKLDINWSPIPDSYATWGRHGDGGILGNVNIVRPGVPLDIVPGNDLLISRNRFLATRDPHTSYDFFGYPVFDVNWAQNTIASLPSANPLRIYLESAIQAYRPTSFGISPDLRARYAIGLDYTGQPVYEAAYEQTLATIVDDSPYELNLTDGFRNDSVADSRSMVNSYNTPSPINDDAPFSIAELERILRANDADMGGVPDRLWNLVDAFDPVKLAATPQYLTSFSEPTARLAQAQIDAAINRRLVTTESWDVPVPTGNMYTRCLLGADGKPGRAWVDDDGDNFTDKSEMFDPDTGEGEIGWYDPSDATQYSDDYTAVMRETVPQGASLVDYLRYRIVLELKNKQVIAGDIPATDPAVEVEVNKIIAQLMPPDVMAGLKMDLNRPFGDGRDNNGNGVVDEPIEAGEPFVDMNGNRAWDAGEPFLDLDGDNRYYADTNDDGVIDLNDQVDLDGDGVFEMVVDNLWAQQLGSPVPFSYDAGFRGVIVNVGGNAGELINPYDTVRQLYARHLYVLARLTMDENYVAPYDEDNLQLRNWMDELKEKLTMANPALTPQDAELIVRKKLTYRELAQWAINCADMRDADVIMTAFEYDENPWDGWGSFDYRSPPGVFIPLDGDLRTDEDLAYVQTVSGNLIDAPEPLPSGELLATDKTRGVVWGAERPELLITETIGLHDRRTEDLTPADLQGHATMNAVPDNDRYKDRTLDQRQPPRGSLFVEVHNAWSGDGQRPAELYSIHPRNADGEITGPAIPSPGVELGRVSNGFYRDPENDDIEKHSPVWRLIVVEEHPEYRNEDDLDDLRADGEDRGELEIPNGPTVFRHTNPDFPGFDYSAMPAKIGVTNHNGIFEYEPPKQETWEYQRNRFGLPYPFVEREFYFTAGGSRTIDDIDPNRNSARYSLTSSRYDVADGQFRLRIPNRSIDYTLAGGGGRVRAQTQKFLHPDAEQYSDLEWQIAPILPGSYGVIGSAGARYDARVPQELRDGFVTTMGRLKLYEGSDAITRFRPELARRIELRVGRDLLGALRNRVYNADPLLNPNQVFIRRNGGKVGATRDNELLMDSASNMGTESNGRYGPAVGIPVEDMNISEPPWEYQARESENSQRESGIGAGRAALEFNRRLAKGEGAYARGSGANASADSFDEPFDDAPELVRTGTTLNYRTIHLQRLANPLQPWNPAPGEFTRLDRNGDTVDAHVPTLPINPYRTIDSSSVDLTAYNGISSLERSQPQGPGEPERPPNQRRPWITNESAQFSQNPNQRWIGRTHERGAWAALRTMIGPDVESLPTRAIWQQEPAKTEVLPEYFLDLTPWVDPTLQEATDRQRRKITMTGEQSRNLGYPDDNVMHVDMVLEHSLGFGNEAIGRILSVEDGSPAVIVNGMNTTYTSALGAPAPESGINTLNTASTYPWLAWNNRPYSSDMELLQIPSRSSSEMLRNYSVTNPYAGVDPYNGNLPAPPPAAQPTPEELNDLRDANHHGHFGHLMNFFESAALPADVMRQPDGTPIVDGTAGPDSYIPIGAPHYYRLLDYVHVPSKFVGTDTMLNPRVFNRLGEDLVINQPSDPLNDDVLLQNDPRQSLLTPFNRVAKYREPGRVNINTISDARVWDGGVMHRRPVDPTLPYDPIRNPYLPEAGHLGLPFHAYDFAGNTVPGLADLRRGYLVNGALPPVVPYGSPPNFDPMYYLDPKYPTIFANPFRSGDAGDLVPLANMMQSAPTDPLLKGGVHATMLRGTGVVNPTTMLPTTEVSFSDQSPQSTVPHFDVSRNPYLKYSALNKAGSSATTRSNVFAVWVTVGFFEVVPVTDEIRQRYMNDPVQRDLFNRIYPEGYMLAQEIGSDTGNIKRHRGFYIIDRSLPAGFMPGVDVNVDDLIKLRRRIE